MGLSSASLKVRLPLPVFLPALSLATHQPVNTLFHTILYTYDLFTHGKFISRYGLTKISSDNFREIFRPQYYGDICIKIVKSKSVPLQAWSGPEGSTKLRFPDFVTTAQDGGKVVSLTHRLPLPPGNIPWYSFLLEVESTPGP